MSTTQTIPKEHTAAIKQGQGEGSSAPIQTVGTPNPGLGQILVKINYTGLCSSDKSLIYDEWAPFGVSMQPDTKGIAGHEGAGVVVAVADDVKETGLWKVGDRAGIKWIADVCGSCEMCKETENGGEVMCVIPTL